MSKMSDLQAAMIQAMKDKDKFRKETISTLVSAAKKAGIDAGCREDIPDDMVNAAILKEIKSCQEQVDTCPKDRAELIEEYTNKVNIMKEFAPKQLDADEIREIITSKFAEIIASKDKGAIMKAVMGELKGKADGKLINQIVAELMK